jgi:branched-chain amino acid transport system substrate-binding protein
MSRSIVAILAFIALAWTSPSRAEEVYLVGVTAALTGPIASVSGPVVDGMRIYLERINAAGGINGKPIRLLIRDDQSEATKAAANVKRLLEEDNVLLLINESASSTYQPTMAESKRVARPLLFLGVCPTEVYPPAQPLFFCTTSYAAHYDSRAALDYIKEAHGSTDLTIGLMSQSIPIARAEIDYAEVRSKEMNMHPVDKELLPPATADFTPFATKFSELKPDWIWSWSAWELQTGTLEAMRRLGWAGKFLGWSHIQAEDSLPQVKDREMYSIGTDAYFIDGLPVQAEIIAAAKAAGITYPATRLAEGWIAGMAVEAAFRALGGNPATPEALAQAMSNLTIDPKGLRGSPIVWTKNNHFRTQQSYRVYHWNGTKLEAIGDWRRYDVM